MLPKTLPINTIFTYLFKAFEHIAISREKLLLQKNLKEMQCLDSCIEHYNLIKEDAIEIHEDTRCSICSKKLKKPEFVLNKEKNVALSGMALPSKGEISLLHIECWEALKKYSP
jgi:hypothetical protein